MGRAVCILLSCERNRGIALPGRGRRTNAARVRGPDAPQQCTRHRTGGYTIMADGTLAKRAGWATGLALAVAAGPALAQDAAPDGANTAWILTSTALVLFMTLPGLALFYGGLVRSKNVLNILMQCFSIACLASILWYALGYS